MAGERVLVEILNGIQSPSGCDCTNCASSCGPATSQKKWPVLAENLHEAFGNQVEVPRCR